MDSRTFYDNYVERQLRVGVNQRHRAILDWAVRFGMQPHHRVLEIGCGVGTVTGLLGAFLGRGGSVLGVDLSPESIRAGRTRLDRLENVALVAGDILEMEVSGPFDVLVLPDVIEHIPLESHPRLFERLASWVSPDGFVLLHYPNPIYLEWCHVHSPEHLQFVDQPVHADLLTANAYASGFHLEFLQTYSIWVKEGDYVVAVLRPRRRDVTFHDLPAENPSFMARAEAKARLLWGRWAEGRMRDRG